MTPEQFHEWRKSLGLTQAEAAERLGVSKRSVFSYESAGPVPKSIGLACVAISDQDQRGESYEKLVKEQHPKLGDNLLVLPFVIEREATYGGVVDVALSDEVREWVQENTPSAQFSRRTVITPDRRRREVAVVVFENLTEVAYFKLRWC
jgi:transcriptional regulator with XRE-family HTH domain